MRGYRLIKASLGCCSFHIVEGEWRTSQLFRMDHHVSSLLHRWNKSHGWLTKKSSRDGYTYLCWLGGAESLYLRPHYTLPASSSGINDLVMTLFWKTIFGKIRELWRCLPFDISFSFFVLFSWSRCQLTDTCHHSQRNTRREILYFFLLNTHETRHNLVLQVWVL